MESTAIPIEKVGERWQQWQRANPEQAKAEQKKLVDWMIKGNTKAAMSWHAKNVAVHIGLPVWLVREYIWRHGRD